MPPKTFIGVVSALLVAVLVGCGGDDSSSGDKAAGDKGGKANSAEVKKLIRQTFGPNAQGQVGQHQRRRRHQRQGPSALQGADPGQPRRPVHERRRPARGDARRLARRCAAGSSAATCTSRTARPTSASARPPTRSRRRSPGRCARRLSKTGNALDAIMGVFHINPDRWAKNPRIVGNERDRRDRHDPRHGPDQHQERCSSTSPRSPSG